MPDEERLHLLMRDIFIDNGSVFFGGYSTHLYSKYMPENKRKVVSSIPEYDILEYVSNKIVKILVLGVHNRDTHTPDEGEGKHMSDESFLFFDFSTLLESKLW